MNQMVVVVAVDARAAEYHASVSQSLFGAEVATKAYGAKQALEAGLPAAALYCVTTDALEQLPDFREMIAQEAQVVEIGVTFTQRAIELLEQVPEGTEALLVNMSEKMAGEAITRLNQLGVNHIRFRPFYPGAAPVPGVKLAVTPAEERYVPEQITQIIQLGQRQMDCNTIVEIALKLHLYSFLESERFKEYQRSIVSNSYGFDELFSRSLRLESGFQSMIDLLEVGIVGVNEKGLLFVVNKKAEKLLCTGGMMRIGQPAAEVVPWISLDECVQSQKKIDARLVKIKNMSPVTVQVTPILRNKACMGAIAMLQSFNEEEAQQHEMRIRLLDKGHKAKYTFDDIIGESATMQQAKMIAEKMAKTRASVLITGESGTGKELFAHAIHNASPRSAHPFIAINCAALPENLLESELFGYADGAFTGARKGGKLGLFEFAHQGTFFLDEVEGMSPLLQIKLLRVIQEHEVMRIGDTKLIAVDVRIVAATNENLEQLVKDGKFRSDLYYRLCTLPVQLPPLRERPEDIAPLLEQFCRDTGGEFVLSEQAMTLLLHHPWRGNIRELHNCVEYLTYLGKEWIEPEDLPPAFHRIESLDAASPQPEVAAGATDRAGLVLSELWLADKKSLGREQLAERLRAKGCAISEYELRTLLATLAQQELVTISRGRGGTRITKKGEAALRDGLPKQEIG